MGIVIFFKEKKTFRNFKTERCFLIDLAHVRDRLTSHTKRKIQLPRSQFFFTYPSTLILMTDFQFFVPKVFIIDLK